MSGNEVQALLGCAIARMESAKHELLMIFEETYPQMIDDKTRSRWARCLIMANLQQEAANGDVHQVAKIILGEALPHHCQGKGEAL